LCDALILRRPVKQSRMPDSPPKNQTRNPIQPTQCFLIGRTGLDRRATLATVERSQAGAQPDTRPGDGLHTESPPSHPPHGSSQRPAAAAAGVDSERNCAWTATGPPRIKNYFLLRFERAARGAQKRGAHLGKTARDVIRHFEPLISRAVSPRGCPTPATVGGRTCDVARRASVRAPLPNYAGFGQCSRP